jgi:hypothetical protein
MIVCGSGVPPAFDVRPSPPLDELYPVPRFRLATGPLGMPIVLMSIIPPPNAAVASGDGDFWILIDSTMLVGKISSGTTLRVRSGDGTAAPLTSTLE